LPIAHELLLINDTIDFPNSTDTNGFSYFYYNADMPVNWRSPDDYYYGEVYVRYEIISQKTETPVGLQFGIWQLLPPETGELHETMSDILGMNGTGSVVISNSSPSKWWKLDGGFDYTKMNLTWHFGINPWKLDPVNGYNKQIRQENASVWAERNTYWFPMKVAVTVVAVAYDHTFSGWDNYISTSGSKKPKPNFGIDYINEQTTSAVPSTVEYSYDSNMSFAVNGNGQKLALTPGTDVYFRTKAGGGLLASDIQHLVVPARAAAPVFSIDYRYERTAENITSEYQYADNESFTNLSTGTGGKISLIPGQDVYFRKKGTSSAFLSETLHLVNPLRPDPPSVSIDYFNEKTNEVLSSSVQYSANSSYTDAVTCSNAKVDLNPGTDLYFWINYTASSYASLVTVLDVPGRPSTPSVTIDYSLEKTSVIANTQEWSTIVSMSTATQGQGASITVTPGTDLYFRYRATSIAFKSTIQFLDVPARLSAPTVTIDYTNEKTSTVATSLEWSDNASLSPATQGLNAPVSLVPGSDIYLCQKATVSTFRSEIQHLIMPQRPSTPEITVDYINERTSSVPASMEWSVNASMTPATVGGGNSLAVTPGTDLYFRVGATASSFRSAVQHLTIAQRPETPVFTIDYSNVTTNETAGTDIEFSISADLSGSTTGVGTKVLLNPGQDMYFRKKAGDSFRSDVYHLSVPNCNFLVYSGEDTITSSSFTMYAILVNGSTGFSVDDLLITNGTAGNLRTGNVFDVYASAEGLVSVIIPARTVTENSFASNEVTVYSKTSTGFPGNAMNLFSIYPNPSSDGTINIETNTDGAYTIDLISMEGKILRKIEMNGGKHQQLRLDDLKKGMYYLKMVSDRFSNIQKIILE
jgi:hypothetical protein